MSDAGDINPIDPIDALSQAIATERAVLAAVRPEQLSMQSPCAQWTVAQVIAHSLGTFGRFATAMTGASPADTSAEFIAGDLTAFDAVSAACLGAFEADGVLSGTISLGPREMLATMAITLLTTDSLVHSWDIARGSGQTTDLAPALAASVLARSQQTVRPEQRGPDGTAPFGPEQPVADDATHADKLAAYLGRTV